MASKKHMMSSMSVANIHNYLEGQLNLWLERRRKVIDKEYIDNLCKEYARKEIEKIFSPKFLADYYTVANTWRYRDNADVTFPMQPLHLVVSSDDGRMGTVDRMGTVAFTSEHASPLEMLVCMEAIPEAYNHFKEVREHNIGYAEKQKIYRSTIRRFVSNTLSFEELKRLFPKMEIVLPVPEKHVYQAVSPSKVPFSLTQPDEYSKYEEGIRLTNEWLTSFKFEQEVKSND